MDTTEFSGIHIDNSPTFQRDPLDPGPGEDLVNALPRKRNNVSNTRSSDEAELEKLRKLVEEAEKERRNSGVSGGSQRGSIEPSLMSAVFGVVLLIIITMTVFAFASLYNALVKRFSQDQK